MRPHTRAPARHSPRSLKHYPNKGVCGLPEQYDSERQLASGLNTLVELVRKAKHLVVLTGAGISTTAGIPDFRGPGGMVKVASWQDYSWPARAPQTTHLRG